MGKPQLGQIVSVLQGRDAQNYAVIVGFVDCRFVLIADGNKRKFDHPKKKNILHLELFNEVNREVEDSLRETGRVTNGKLRFALNKFQDNQKHEAQERGE
ncbi:MAG: KOW domain-containing RNA-binding protein [Gorillibacterium sp.]|nr:KOW domain-containing RNA-binding protein [Gorillibacterium sp.]